MISNSPQSNEQKVFQKLSQILQEKKGLKTIIPKGSKGGFGLVLFVEDVNTGQKYAVKAQSIIDDVAGGIDDDKFELCKAESEILKNVKHKNIVEYHSDYTIGFYHFIQMNLCECSLDDWIQSRGNNKISQGAFINFFNQILDGIEHLHSLNYVLRDLSTRNILISSDGVIKLCDFGLAKKIESSLLTSMIQSNNVKGVFAYYPPELMVELEGNSNLYTQSKSGDIWAFGICLSLLGGISFLQVAQFNQPGAQIKTCPLLDDVCNSIIQYILQPTPSQRPSISQIRKSVFQSLNSNQPIKSQIEQAPGAKKTNNSALQVQSNIQKVEFDYNKRDLTIDIERYKQIEQECLLKPGDIESVLKLSIIYTELYYNYEKGQQYAEQALKLNSQDPDVYLVQSQIGILRYKLENLVQSRDQAIEYLKQAEQIQPNYWRVYFLYSKLYNHFNQKESKIYCLKALALNDKNDELIIYSHFIKLDESNDSGKLILEQIENINVQKKFKNYFHQMAFIADSLRDYKKAISYLEKEISCFPNPTSCLNLANIYQKLGDKKKAKEYYSKVFEIYPKLAF